MKITFILPAIGKKQGQKYIGTWKMEPLTISTLKAITPKEIETEFFDDRIEEINFDTKTDAVAISVETYSAARAYEVASRFRARNIPVIMGGFHTTLVPDEASLHADSVVIGNAESVWEIMLTDLQQGTLKKSYRGELCFSNAVQDRSLFAGKKYLPLGLIETGRGCRFKCEFCAITAYYDAKYKSGSISRVLEEIKESPYKVFFFVDDNIVADTQFAIELFKALVPLKIKWAGQATLTIAKNPELLYWMKKSGCFMVLIGFESLDEKNLQQMSKQWRSKIGEQNELVRAIHKAGINIYATFVFGFDNDTRDTVQAALEFAQKHKFFLAAFNHLLPFPGTPLYERMRKDNSLNSEKWWLDPNYTYGTIAFNPKQISAAELSDACVEARHAFFSISSVVKRGLAFLTRKPSLYIFIQYWIQSFVFRKEVDQKMGLPMGKGLNESTR